MPQHELPSRADILLLLSLASAAAFLSVHFGQNAAEIPAVLAWWLFVLLACDAKWARGLASLSGCSPNGLRLATCAAIAVPAVAIEAGAPDGWRRLVVATSLALLGLVVSALFRRFSLKTNAESLGELARWATLTLVSLFVTLPYAHPGLVGSGDARFYALQLADVIHQLHAGTFETFVGQTNFAIAGDFHPLRTAPYFQHLGLLLDVATAGLLQPITLTNLAIVLSGVGGAFSCYLSLVRLAPERRKLSLVLALLYITSPGVLALLYGGDMFASWMTLPWLPLAIYGFVVLAEHGFTLGRSSALAVVMAGLWWAHAPIAMWTSLAGLAFVAAGLVRGPVSWPRSKLIALAAGALVFVALSSYLFVSVFQLELPLRPDQIRGLRQTGIMNSLVEGWQGLFQPVSADGSHLLHDLQLSIGLWFCLAAALVGIRRIGRSGLLLLVTAAGFFLLLAPVHGLAGRIWEFVPARVLRASDQWPMQRFYPILSAIAPFAGLLALRHIGRKPYATVILWGLTAAASWSLLEVRKFQNRGYAVTWPKELSRLALLPENAGISNYSKCYANADSPLDSQAPSDPRLDIGMYDRERALRTPTNLDFAARLFQTRASEKRSFVVSADAALLTGTLNVAPGHRRLVQFDFKQAQPEGTLIVCGHRIYQEYPLPSSGGPLAFGARPENGKILSLWITGHIADDVTIRFIPKNRSRLFTEFADIRTLDIKTEELPLDIRSVGPGFRITAAFPSGWVVTPRIFVPGYRAWVDGKPTLSARSPGGRIMVKVPEGVHSMLLKYEGTFALRATYRLGMALWLLGVPAALVYRLCRQSPGKSFSDVLPEESEEAREEPFRPEETVLPELDWPTTTQLRQDPAQMREKA